MCSYVCTIVIFSKSLRFIVQKSDSNLSYTVVKVDVL